jgi:hypothetical protein
MYYEDENYGKLITDVSGFEKGSGSVVITFEDGSTFHMWHSQDCCETVDINDIEGDTDLVGAIWQGYDERSEAGTENDYGSSTWTFYTIYTNRGYTWVRWLGESNGYYSEGVSHGYYAAGESRSYW